MDSTSVRGERQGSNGRGVTQLMVIVSLLAAGACAGVGKKVRIMPIGDSITRGSYLVGTGLPNQKGGGWRKILQDNLLAIGVPFEFVGELDYHAYGDNGVIDPAFSPRHHGLAGFSNKRLRTGGEVPTPQDVLEEKGVEKIVVPGIVEALHRNRPDVILLMSGSNGFDAAERDLLVETIAEHFKGELFVANIPPQKPPRPGRDRVDAYNASLPALVERLKVRNADIHFVDMSSALSADDLLADGVHPNPDGNRKIAETWFEALRKVSTYVGPGTAADDR